jgi:hypothetical protein
MIGWLENNGLERILNEAVLVWFEKLPLQLSGGTAKKKKR